VNIQEIRELLDEADIAYEKLEDQFAEMLRTCS
jgi:hypothetical protein